MPFKVNFLTSLVVFLLRICLVKSSQRVSYNAAVVEYAPLGSPWQNSATEIIRMNLEQYKGFIVNASKANADIIAFPEYGLTTLGIPRDRDTAKPFMLRVPEIGENPCMSQIGSLEIQELSCTTRLANIYVVVNLAEIRSCQQDAQTCPADGDFQFNSNIVFNRQGLIVAKYEKANLYFEDQFDKPDPVTLSTFTTDFDVQFGVFTCYDIIFQNPAVNLVERGISNFIFPTAWVDELPFLMAIQAQAAWAFSANANLIAAGYHQPLGGQLGSGIYSGKDGHLAYTFDSDSGSKMLISEVPIIPKQNFNSHNSDSIIPSSKSNIAAYHSFLREDLQNYTTQILDLTSTTSYKICTENDFCCELNFKVNELKESNSLPTENYRLMAFNGNRTVAAKTAEYHWQVCGIVRCLNETLESCSENDKSDESNLSNFSFLELSAYFDIPMGTKFLPAFNALDVKLDLIPSSSFDIQSDESFMQLSSSGMSSILMQIGINPMKFKNAKFNANKIIVNGL